MSNKKAFVATVLIGAAGLMMHAGAARADALALDYRNGTTVLGSDGINALAVPGDYSYAQLVLNSQTVSGADSFFDDYVFSVSEGVASSVTATVDLGTLYDLNNLQVRLYQLDSAYVSWSPSASQPSGVLAVYNATVTTSGGSATATLDDIDLVAGNYVLQISGEAAGSTGGVYGGLLLLQPVPLPAAGWLLFSGLLGLGGLARRKQK